MEFSKLQLIFWICTQNWHYETRKPFLTFLNVMEIYRFSPVFQILGYILEFLNFYLHFCILRLEKPLRTDSRGHLPIQSTFQNFSQILKFLSLDLKFVFYGLQTLWRSCKSTNYIEFSKLRFPKIRVLCPEPLPPHTNYHRNLPN